MWQWKFCIAFNMLTWPIVAILSGHIGVHEAPVSVTMSLRIRSCRTVVLRINERIVKYPVIIAMYSVFHPLSIESYMLTFYWLKRRFCYDIRHYYYNFVADAWWRHAKLAWPISHMRACSALLLSGSSQLTSYSASKRTVSPCLALQLHVWINCMNYILYNGTVAPVWCMIEIYEFSTSIPAWWIKIRNPRYMKPLYHFDVWIVKWERHMITCMN